ncbi:hypothetical protein JD844_016497 [Phrynosoma platyrhinos]|uniref:DDE Tnp4 domain-containing protein n=1 Tax=Phrynosoma platyrhinos TaxID=52577 RepID=A0ABQ7SKI3_PHRPL|nr:hypothetical protein JD844_016497 [Phrynosoma platyrhinos]
MDYLYQSWKWLKLQAVESLEAPLLFLRSKDKKLSHESGDLLKRILWSYTRLIRNVNGWNKIHSIAAPNGINHSVSLEVYANKDEDVAVDDGTIDWQIRQNDADDDDLNSFSQVGEVTQFRSAMKCFYEPMARRAMPVEKQVAIAVYFLVNKGSYVNIATIFGVGKSRACKTIIQLVLLNKTVYLGNYRKLAWLCTLLIATCTFPLPLQVVAVFGAMGFPQVIRAVDGCHCNIISLVHQGGQFINRKQRYSMLLQGTCDRTGRFIDLVTGWVGSNHDSFVLWSSRIYSTLRAGVCVPRKITVTIFRRQVGPLLLADAVYPLSHG